MANTRAPSARYPAMISETRNDFPEPDWANTAQL